jgi:colanic acid biosynthesis glycosyl transferase WcaI
LNEKRKPKEIAVIQFYFYPDMSAASQMLHDLLVGLSTEDEFRFTVFCSDHYPRNGAPVIAPTQLNRNLFIKRIRTFHFGKKSIITRLLEYSFFYLSVFFTMVVSSKWDCVISLTSPPLIAFAAVCGLLFKRTSFVYYIQDLYPEILFDLHYVNRPFFIRKLQILNRIIFRRAARIITIGDYMTKKITAHYRIRNNSIVEIPNWAKDISFLPPERKDKINLLYSGNIGLAHDFSLLPPLIRSLKNDPRVSYTFSGGGKNREAVVSLFEQERENRISFAGYIKREGLSTLLGSAALFLIAQSAATVGDILPSKIYASLAAGRPVIFLGPRQSETAALIIKNDIGMVIENAADAARVPEYLNFLFNDFSNFIQICRRTRTLFEQKHQMHYSLNRFSHMLHSLLPDEAVAP